MKTFIFNILVSILALLFITYIGIDEIKTDRVGLGVGTMLLGFSNIPLMYLHWLRYKRSIK